MVPPSRPHSMLLEFPGKVGRGLSIVSAQNKVEIPSDQYLTYLCRACQIHSPIFGCPFLYRPLLRAGNILLGVFLVISGVGYASIFILQGGYTWPSLENLILIAALS